MDKEIMRINTSVNRDIKAKQGAFDGRFKTISIPSKKIYTRKKKHGKKPCD